MKSGIYIITCLVNGKVYIGRAKDYLHRIKQHKLELNRNNHVNLHLQNAVNLYGIENFTFELLEEWEEEFLCSMENWWCNMLQAHNPEFGYNIAPTNPYGKVSNSKQTRERISKSRMGIGKGIPLSEQHRKNLSIAGKGRKASKESIEKFIKSRKGYRHSEETKLKIGIKSRERTHSEDTKIKIGISVKLNHKHTKHTEERKKQIGLEKSIPIVQLTLDNKFIQEYVSAYDANRKTGIINTSISKVILGKQKTARGFKWMKLEEYNKLNDKL